MDKYIVVMGVAGCGKSSLGAALAQAGEQVRRERAPLLGLNPQAAPAHLLDQLQRRANDGAQTRPE